MNGCCLPYCPIAVDLWKLRQCPRVRHFFLSHVHLDQSCGLSSSWSLPIYCSHVSKKLLIQQFQLDESVVHGLDLDIPHIIPLTPASVTTANDMPTDTGDSMTAGSVDVTDTADSADSSDAVTITVTLIDANHCPGSVMFLFTGYFGRILYTGDFRFDESMFSRGPLSEISGVDTLYIDNTFCSSKCMFPRRDDALQEIVNIIDRHPTERVVFGLRPLGKEEMLVALANRYRTKITVSAERFHTLQLLGIEDKYLISGCEEQSRFQVVPLVEVTRSNVDAWNRLTPTIAILPTALFVGLGYQPFTASTDIFVVPYSDHSPFSELREFVSRIRPKSVVPITRTDPGSRDDPLAASLLDRTNMECFADCLDRTAMQNYHIPAAVLEMMNNSSGTWPVSRSKRQRSVRTKSSSCRNSNNAHTTTTTTMTTEPRAMMRPNVCHHNHLPRHLATTNLLSMRHHAGRHPAVVSQHHTSAVVHQLASATTTKPHVAVRPIKRCSSSDRLLALAMRPVPHVVFRHKLSAAEALARSHQMTSLMRMRYRDRPVDSPTTCCHGNSAISDVVMVPEKDVEAEQSRALNLSCQSDAGQLDAALNLSQDASDSHQVLNLSQSRQCPHEHTDTVLAESPIFPPSTPVLSPSTPAQSLPPSTPVLPPDTPVLLHDVPLLACSVAPQSCVADIPVLQPSTPVLVPSTNTACAQSPVLSIATPVLLSSAAVAGVVVAEAVAPIFVSSHDADGALDLSQDCATDRQVNCSDHKSVELGDRHDVMTSLDALEQSRVSRQVYRVADVPGTTEYQSSQSAYQSAALADNNSLFMHQQLQQQNCDVVDSLSVASSDERNAINGLLGLAHATSLLQYTAPVVSSTAPLLQNTAEVLQYNAPLTGAIAPLLQYTAPVVSSTVPLLQYNAPLTGSTAPLLQYTAPLLQYSTPVVSTTAPLLQYTTPVMSTTALLLQYTAPVASSMTSLLQYSAPVMNTTAPLLQYSAPVMNTNAPLLQYSAPEMQSVDSAANYAHTDDYNNEAWLRRTQHNNDAQQLHQLQQQQQHHQLQQDAEISSSQQQRLDEGQHELTPTGSTADPLVTSDLQSTAMSSNCSKNTASASDALSPASLASCSSHSTATCQMSLVSGPHESLQATPVLTMSQSERFLHPKKKWRRRFKSSQLHHQENKKLGGACAMVGRACSTVGGAKAGGGDGSKRAPLVTSHRIVYDAEAASCTASSASSSHCHFTHVFSRSATSAATLPAPSTISRSPVPFTSGVVSNGTVGMVMRSRRHLSTASVAKHPRMMLRAQRPVQPVDLSTNTTHSAELVSRGSPPRLDCFIGGIAPGSSNILSRTAASFSPQLSNVGLGCPRGLLHGGVSPTSNNSVGGMPPTHCDSLGVLTSGHAGLSVNEDIVNRLGGEGTEGQWSPSNKSPNDSVSVGGQSSSCDVPCTNNINNMT